MRKVRKCLVSHFNIFNYVKFFRLRNKLTQTDLALLVGVSQQSIGSIESGKRIPSLDLALCLAGVFNVEFYDLFYLSIRSL